jgi:ankyrin repeat protein
MLFDKNGHVGVVRVLLQHPNKVNVNESCSEGRAAFSWACEEGHSDVVCEFLKHDTVVDAAVVNAKDNQGRTTLMIAISKGYWASLKHMEVDVNSQDNKGRTALYWASAKGKWEIVLELLQSAVVDVNVQGAHGNTVLIWACLRGRLDIVRELLKDDRVDVSVRNKAGSTALDIARKCNLFEIARRLEEHSKACQRREWEAKALRQDVELHNRERIKNSSERRISTWKQTNKQINKQTNKQTKNKKKESMKTTYKRADR